MPRSPDPQIHRSPDPLTGKCHPWKAMEMGLRVAKKSTSRVLLEIIIAEHLSYALCRLIVVVFAVRSCRCPADNQTRLVAPILSGCTWKINSNFKKIFWKFKTPEDPTPKEDRLLFVLISPSVTMPHCQFWRLLAGIDSTCISVGIFQAKSGQCGIDWLGRLATDLDLFCIWSLGPGGLFSLWLLFSCFGCCVCVSAAFQQIDSTIIETDMWLICTEDCSVCSFSSPRNWLCLVACLLAFFFFIHIFYFYFFSYPLAGWQSGTVLCAINFPTVSHSSPGPATLLDTIFDSIRLPNMRVGYLFPYNIYTHTDWAVWVAVLSGAL